MSDRFIRVWNVKATAPGVVTETRQWSELDVEFNVKKSLDRGINEGELTLYNLNSDSRKFLSQRLAIIEISAGYVDDQNTIFTAEIERCTHQLEGPDWKTVLELKDGAATCRTAKSEKTFNENTPYIDAFNSLIGVLTTATDQLLQPLKRGSIDLGGVTGSIQKSLSSSGLAYDTLTSLCNSFGLDCFVTDFTLNIKRKTQPLQIETVVLNRLSGLIGTPEITEDGITVTALMTAKLEPGAEFKLESNITSGLFIVKNMEYKGNSEGGDWYVNIEAVTA